MARPWRPAHVALVGVQVLALVACGGDGDDGAGGAIAGNDVPPSSSLPAAGASGTGVAGADPVPTDVAAGAGAGAGAAAPQAGTGAVGEPAAGSGVVAGEGAEPPPAMPPATCADATAPYTIVTTDLDASFVPAVVSSPWGASSPPRVPVAVDAAGGVFIAFERADAGGSSVVIVRPETVAGSEMVIDDAEVGGLAATSDGVGALLFAPGDPAMWTAVARLSSDGSQLFRTDLFSSPNLDDEGTKGAPDGGRLGYVPGTDTLVAYFGHTERYSDGVRHQGGFLATIDAAGAVSEVSDWYGSHNLQQRLLVDGDRVAVLGLGDAFPKGIFFNYLGAGGGRFQPEVIYRVAADGVGAANAKLGGMVPRGDEILAPFITNLSISQDLDAGAWPNTDEAISMQIRDASVAGTDLGFLRVPSAMPGAELAPTWLDAAPTAGTRLSRLKSAPYGPSLVLLAWAELGGSTRSPTASFYTMVIDTAGAVCQAKTPLAPEYGFGPEDELVATPDGSIVWANAEAGHVQLHRLVP